MVYKDSKYTYKSKKQYQNVLGVLFTTFFVATYFIGLMKHLISDFIYFPIIIIGVLMMIHLMIKYEYSEGVIKTYKFNNL